jgi:glyoxylase-like metal-dependent hydrolase (beta-lactamase superfamily II)
MQQQKGMFPRFKNVTTNVKLNGNDIRIHGLCTGSVSVKANFKKKKGFGEFSKFNILIDKYYTESLPIWVWVIEHPDGLIVVDTGENAKVTDLDKYLENESWFLRYQFKHAAKFEIDETQELDYQFESIGLRLDNVKLVALTHLHLDHTDGLKFFPKQEIIVSDNEYKHARNNMPSTYPKWFNPNRVTYQKGRVEVFDMAYPISRAEDLLYIPTPGHTIGHSSVLFKTDDFDILFSGDASYNQEQVLMSELPGVNASFGQTAKTYKNIADYSRNRNTIYLPTHDGEAGNRLVNRNFLICAPTEELPPTSAMLQPGPKMA